MKTRKVRVNKHETRSFVEEEPLEEVLDVDAEMRQFDDEPEMSPLESFLRSLDSDRNLTLNVYLLPNYAKDGKYGSRSAERSFVTSFQFTSDDVDVYQQRVQHAYPQGGMFHFDLRERGLVVKQWAEAISAAPGYQIPGQPAPNQFPPLGAFPPPPVINVNQPDQPKAVDPLTVAREQIGFAKDLLEIAKGLTPAPAVLSPTEQPEPAPLRDRILEGVVLKLVENPKADSLERVADILNGGRETGWAEALITTVGPHLGGFLTQIGPGLNAWLLRLAGGQPVQAPAPAQAAIAGTAPADGAAPVDPAERAWRRVLFRLLDDLFEHVALLQAGANGLDVHSSAEAVVDLAGRFADHAGIAQTIAQLLAATPEQVIELCSLMVQPQMVERVTQLKTQPAAIAWLAELQRETKEILEGEAGAGADSAETDSPDADQKVER